MLAVHQPGPRPQPPPQPRPQPRPLLLETLTQVWRTRTSPCWLVGRVRRKLILIHPMRRKIKELAPPPQRQEVQQEEIRPPTRPQPPTGSRRVHQAARSPRARPRPLLDPPANQENPRNRRSPEPPPFECPGRRAAARAPPLRAPWSDPAGWTSGKASDTVCYGPPWTDS